jgi:LmbE family N-acetylglucosaminyl deacetylase
VVPELWFHSGPAPDHVVDVTATFPRKLAALAAHVSQTAHGDIETKARVWSTAAAEAAGLPEGCLAEAFTVLRTG